MQDRTESPGTSRHLMQFHHSEAAFLGALDQFLTTPLAHGGRAIVILTPSRRAAVSAWCDRHGIGHDQVRYMDSELLLSLLAPDGKIDQQHVATALARVIDAAKAQTVGRLVMIGDMVSVLWRSGMFQETVELEEAWCEVLALNNADLLCIHEAPTSQGHPEEMASVCALHEPDQPVPNTRRG